MPINAKTLELIIDIQFKRNYQKKDAIMRFVICLALILAAASPAICMERFDLVTTQELVELLSDRSEGKTDFCLVNTLDTLIYEHNSIPGSVNVPWSRAKAFAEKRMGTNKDRLIITY